jgi:hypothetical protein
MPLAHQGGWDEVLVVAAPVAVLMALLWVGSRFAHARADPPAEDGDEPLSP